MNKKLILILGIVLVVAAAAVVIFVFVLGKDDTLPFVRTECTPGEYFVANVKGTNRFLKVTVVIVLNTDTLTETMEEHTSKIRDTIYTILRNQDEDTLREVDLSGVKAEIAAALNETLEIDNIIDILFYDYAIQ